MIQSKRFPRELVSSSLFLIKRLGMAAKEHSMAAYEEWLQLTRPGPGPDNLRRPLWFARPVKPAATAYAYRPSTG